MFGCGLALVLLLVTGTAGEPPIPTTKPHPVPVSAQEAQNAEFCAGCHEKSKGKVVHAAVVLGCGNCHKFTATAEGTNVSLVENGPELCLSCHTDKRPTGDVRRHKPATTDCLGCHEPHATEQPSLLRHATSGSDNVCATCHKQQAGEAPEGGSHHVAVDSGCDTCHRIHNTGERGNKEFDFHLSKKSPQLCAECHADKLDEAAGRVHTPVKFGCTACHDPHNAKNKSLLLRSPGPTAKGNLCYGCHKQGREVKGASRHAALDMGCDTCHTTHRSGASGKNRLDYHLAKGVPELCLGCHDADDASLAKAHRTLPIKNATCTACHDPHQSSSPKLLRAVQHRPFAERGCELCHQGQKDGKMVLRQDGKRQLCYSCHDMREQVEASNAVHGVFTVTDTCTSCHDPHASGQPRLLRSSQPKLCGSCHQVSEGEVRHAPYRAGQCTACHDPHGSAVPKLIRAGNNQLCLSCHGRGVMKATPAAGTKSALVILSTGISMPAEEYDAIPKIALDEDFTYGHPIDRHPVLGKAPRHDGVVSCLSCHTPHTAKVEKLLADPNICFSCH